MDYSSIPWFHPVMTRFPVCSDFFRHVPTDDKLICKMCDKALAEIVAKTVELVDAKRPWVVQFRCEKCAIPFYWCRVCRPPQSLIKGRRMYQFRDIQRHEKCPAHRTNMEELRQEYLSIQEDDEGLLGELFEMPVDDEVVVGSDVDDDEVQPNTDVTNPALGLEENPANAGISSAFEKIDWANLFPDMLNAKLFECESLEPGRGFSNMASLAIRQNMIDKVELVVVLYMLLFAKLNQSLTQAQSELLTMLLDISRHYSWIVLDIPVPVPLPTTMGDMKKMFGNSKYSIGKNIPMVKLKKCGDYVVALPSACLKEALALGITELFYPNGNVKQSESPRGKELIGHALSTDVGKSGHYFELYHLYLWEDDLDPSNVKDNRHKVFVQVLSVAPKDSKTHTTRNTYIICLGPSNSDRTEAQRVIAEDLQMLGTGITCYRGKEKTAVPTIALVFSIHADSPAKASATFLLAGNSHNHTRFGVVGDITSAAKGVDAKGNFSKRLASCATCWQNRKDGSGISLNCSRCFNWKFEGIPYAKPEDYPTCGLGAPVGKFLFLKKISFQSLERAHDTIFNNVSSGLWKKKAWARCYGRTEGLNVDLVDRIYDNASKQVKIPYPSTWGYAAATLRCWLPVPMHLMFLGVAKSLFGEFILEWLIALKCKTSFTGEVRDRLELLSDLNLSWLKAELLSRDGRYGRYISENYLAFVKVCKWLYGGLESLATTDKEYSDPAGKTLGEYSKANLRGWLKARRITIPRQCSKEDLFDLCTSIVEGNGGTFPLIVPPKQQKSTVDEVESLISAMHTMTSRVMRSGSISNEDAEDCDRHIKHFLSCLDQFLLNTTTPGAESNDPSKVRLPAYITKFNFSNLLSIAEAMEAFFSLRIAWEGDGKGEGSLPLLKQKCIKSLKGKQWQDNAMRHYYVLRGIDRYIALLVKTMGDKNVHHGLKAFAELLVKKDFDSIDDPTEDDEQSTAGRANLCEDATFVDHHTVDGTKNYVVYGSVEAFKRVWETSVKPISIVQLTNESFYVVCKGRRIAPEERIFVELRCVFNAENTRTSCGASYHKWVKGSSFTASEKAPANVMVNYAVLLPYRKQNNPNYYYLVTCDWTEMLQDSSIERPKAIGVKYS